MRNFILASTSTIHGSEYLSYLSEEIQSLFENIDEIIFIPYARPSGVTHDEYTETVQKFFHTISIKVKGLHNFENPENAILNAQGIFTGGGNTFLLVKQLHDLNLMKTLKNKIEKGTPYLGTSAGSNIGGVNMKTTNDMPIVYPKSFETMGIIPFNLNPHYLDPDLNSTHKGETRETRILEFLSQNDLTVIGLREGNWIRAKGNTLSVEGKEDTRIFQKDKTPFEIKPGTNLNDLLS